MVLFNCERFVIGCIFLNLLLLVQCSDKMTGGIESGNARLVGVLYEFDGKTPAVGVDIVIRPKRYLADTFGNESSKQPFAGHHAVTDEKGMFTFDSTLENGTYIIEAVSGSDAVLIDSVVLKEGDILLTLSPRSLKPAGALQGTIKLTEGGDPRKVFVLIYGIDRFSRVGSDGTFNIHNLAEADYDLQIVSSLDNYGVIDTANITVVSGNTTDLGIVSLPFAGIPLAKNIAISYDTMLQIVTLKWSKADTTLASGYHVYRRCVDSSTSISRLNSSLQNDTFYLDSSARQNFTYEYKVTIVDKQGNEGNFGNGADVKIASAYEPVKVIETRLQTSPLCFIMVNGKIYAGSWGSKRIQIIDTAGEQIGFFGDTGAVTLNSMRAITCKNNILYVADVEKNTSFGKSIIKCFDLAGKLIKTIPYPSPAIEIYDLVVISENEFITTAIDRRYILTNNVQQLFKTDSLGAILDSIEYSGNGQIIYQDSFLVYPRPSREPASVEAVFYNLNFDIVRTITIARFAMNGTLAIGNGKFFAVVYENFNRVLVADSNGALISRFESNGSAIIVDPEGFLFIWDGSKITAYKER